MGKHKPSGLNAGRKLRNHRRLQLWADLGFKKQNNISKWKKPFACSSHAAGIVVEKVAVEAKQPNSAVRKCVRVQLKKNNKRITAYVPRDGGMSFIDENDEVLVAGFGRSGHAKGDLPGVRFKIAKVAGCGLMALWTYKKEKPVH
jgi:small subunit ribosomal protein S23e